MAEPIQFGAPAAAQPTPQPIVQTAPEVAPETELKQDVIGAEQDAAELAHDALPVAEEFVHTHQTVLTDLMTQLEGIAHLGKSEIAAIVDQARERFQKL